MNGEADASLPARSLSRSSVFRPPAPDSSMYDVASEASTKSVGRGEGSAAEGVHREQHLIVLEVGRLQPCFDAVGEPHDGDAHAGDLAALGDCGRCRLLGHQLGRRRSIVPRHDGDVFGRAERGDEIGFRRRLDLLLLRRHGQDDAARAGEPRSRHRCHLVERDSRQYGLHQPVLVLDAGCGFLRQEVADVFLRERSAFFLPALVERAFVRGDDPALRAIELRGAEAVLPRPLRLDHECAEPLGQAAVRDPGVHREGLDRSAERFSAGACAEELRVGPPLQFGEALVEHLLEQVARSGRAGSRRPRDAPRPGASRSAARSIA